MHEYGPMANAAHGHGAGEEFRTWLDDSRVCDDVNELKPRGGLVRQASSSAIHRREAEGDFRVSTYEGARGLVYPESQRALEDLTLAYGEI
jgi:hypothetical protein